jgi:hypothetical protein
VSEIAGLVHPEAETHSIYRQTVLTRGNEPVQVFDDPSLPSPVVLKATTLTAVKDYVQAEIAQRDVAPLSAFQGPPPTVIVQVVSPTLVQVLSPIVGNLRQQFVYLTAAPDLPRITLGGYMDILSFHIQLATAFVDTAARQALRAFCGPLQAGRMLKLHDDGVSQSITTTAGIQRQNPAEEVQQLWTLAPYRTFPEIDQPESLFLLRLDDKGGEGKPAPVAALFEADGGAWRMRAVTAIGEWLRGELPAGTIVIS